MHDLKEHKCLKPILENLQEASREAVVDGSQALKENSFKEYFHVKRPIQGDLESIVKSATQNKQLILVCGNVGDGKSHLLSLLHQRYPDEMKGFTVHNDATESNDPKETYLDTIEKLLAGFKDENLTNNEPQKVILAINLGTLTNFLEERGSSFGSLWKYVKNNHILDTAISEDKTTSPYFKHVNFADYHLYELTAQGATSIIISSLFKQLTKESSDNKIWESYQQNCVNCELAEKCPIKFNYEFVRDKQVQETLTHLLIKCIVQYKHLISVRALLNFFYNLIVPLELAPLNTQEIHKAVKNYSPTTFINNTLPNYLFEHPDLSSIFRYLHLLDPVALRQENLDQVVIRLITTDNVSKTFEEEAGLPVTPSYFNNFLRESFQASTKSKNNYTTLINLFIRWHFFKGTKQGKTQGDDIYQKYLQSLYHFNNDGSQISVPHQNLYNEIKEAIYKWNGNAFQNDMVNVFIGHQQNKYKISQNLKLKPKVPPHRLPQNKETLKKFKDTLTLRYSIEGNNTSEIEIAIDYELYQLLQKVVKGYRPNKLDKSNHINFVHIVDKIINLNSQDTPLTFHENNGKSKQGYRLSKDDFGNYRFELI